MPVLNSMDVANQLKKIRKRKCISQSNLAELIEVHFTHKTKIQTLLHAK